MDQRVIRILEFDKIRQMLAEKAVSELGRQLALKLKPATDINSVTALMEETKEAESILMRYSSAPLMSFSDVKSEVKRLETQGVLNCKELLRLNGVFKAAKTAKANIKKDNEGQIRILPEMAGRLFFDGAFIQRIDNAVLDETHLADGASDELFRLRRALNRENDKLRDKLSSLAKDEHISRYLQDAIVTSRNGRYVVPVKAEHKKDVKGLVHDQSASGQTLFIEPESVVEANNKIRELEAEIKAEEHRILAELSAAAAPYYDAFAADTEILAYLDLVFSKASLAGSMKASPPEFNEDGILHIKSGRHPLVNAKTVVPVTIMIGGDYTALIVTGPNTGGKTVSLKTCGLFQLMAQSGLFLPALASTTLPVFKRIFADIGDEQSIEQSLSTFSSHMANIIPILKNAKTGALVLLDELGAGTDPAEGAALAMSILEEVKNNGAYVMATTHYSEIKAFAMAEPGYENASMEFDIKTLSPTYRLKMGIPGLSNAFEISRKLGISDHVVARAKSHMTEERTRFEQLLNEAAASEEEARKKIEQAEDFKRKSQSLKDKAKLQQEKAEKQEKAIIRKAKEEAAEVIKAAREEAEAVISSLKKARPENERELTQAIQSARSALEQQRQALSDGIKDMDKPGTPGEMQIQVGDEVKLIGVGTKGTVLEAPDNKGIFQIQAGVMKLSAHVSEIESIKPAEKTQIKATSRLVKQAPSQAKMEIDIRGLTIDEGIMELDQYLDEMFLSGLKEVSIIHGKGTGKLRAGIHEFIKRHKHVASYRLGTFGEGETGVTIVTLK